MVLYSQDKGKEVHKMQRIKIITILYVNGKMVKITIISKPVE